jgi:hypothetical protein
MLSEGRSRFSRTAPRRPVPVELDADVVLCGRTVCRARVVDEQGGSLGLVLEGGDAERALGHRGCCMRRTITLRVPGADDTLRDIAAQLIHVSPVSEVCKMGVGFVVSCLNAQDVEHLLGLWARFREE